MLRASAGSENNILTYLTTILGIIVGLLSLVFLVVIHELGHAIIARRNGVVVEEFGIGFPPRAWSKKLKNGVLLSLNWLPLGGFVKMQGESDDSKGQGDYGAATLGAKTRILLAGVAVNYIAAILIFTVLYITGMPKVLPNQFSLENNSGATSGAVISNVQADSPAHAAGLQPGDVVTKINDKTIKGSSDLTTFTKSHVSQNITITYKRSGATKMATTMLRPASDASKGNLGTTSTSIETLHATWSAPIAGIAFSGQLIAATFQGFGTLFADLGTAHFAAAGDQVAGPVGIFGTIFPNALRSGATYIALTIGLISLSLAIMNTLPIPALDGGRWFVTVLFRVLRKPLNKEREERIHGTGFMVLLGLIGLITIIDVGRLFR